MGERVCHHKIKTRKVRRRRNYQKSKKGLSAMLEPKIKFQRNNTNILDCQMSLSVLGVGDSNVPSRRVWDVFLHQPT